MICAVESSSGKPLGLMVGWELRHQKLEVALALDLTGFQEILYQLEYRDDVAAVLGVLFIGRQKLSQHQDDRGEKTLCGIVEEGVLPAVAVIAVRVDNGFGKDLGILFGLRTCYQILRVVPGNIHIAVDQCQQIIAV